jgi:hypothetical protein
MDSFTEKLSRMRRNPINRHSRESGSPKFLEKTGFLLPQE